MREQSLSSVGNSILDKYDKMDKVLATVTRAARDSLECAQHMDELLTKLIVVTERKQPSK